MMLLLMKMALFSCLRFGISRGATSTPDLRRELYAQPDASACVLLLSRRRAHGCMQPEGMTERAFLIPHGNEHCPLNSTCGALVPLEVVNEAILEHKRDRMRLSGLLLDARTRPSSLSFVGSFPQKQFANEVDQNYAWNRADQIVDTDAEGYVALVDVPVFLLQDEDAASMHQRANDNKARIKEDKAANVVDMKLEMRAALDGNSLACLARRSCLPLGGFSVAAVMHAGRPKLGQEKGAVLVTFRLDGGFGLFRENVTAARESMAGLVATLIAAELLSSQQQQVTSIRRIIFAGLAGESFGYLGSRRLWNDWKSQQGSTVSRLGEREVDFIVDVGQLGGAARGKAASTDHETSLFYHETANKTSLSPLHRSLEWASRAPGAASIRRASPLPGKGLPPSSLLALVNASPWVTGAVISDFDNSTDNAYLGSFLDDAEMIDVDAIARSAVLLANALHSLRNGLSEGINVSAVEHLQLDLADVRSRAQALSSCLLHPYPGFDCDAANEFFTPNRDESFSHYVGVLPSYRIGDEERLEDKKNVQKLVWSILGNAVAEKVTERKSCQGYCHRTGEICLRYRPGLPLDSRNGTCVNATVGYTVALEPAFEYKDGMHWQVAQDPSDPNELAPLFTESFWLSDDDLYVKAYLSLSRAQEHNRLMFGLMVTGVSVAVAYGIHRMQEKSHMRH